MAKSILICDDAAFMRMMIKDIRHRGQTENLQRNVNFFIISAERLT